MRHHPVGAAIAIRDRQADAVTVAVQQDVIHAPGVDPDAVDVNAFFTYLI